MTQCIRSHWLNIQTYNNVKFNNSIVAVVQVTAVMPNSVVVMVIIIIITTICSVDDVPDGQGNSNDKSSNHDGKSSYHQSFRVLISTGHNKCLYNDFVHHDNFTSCHLLWLTYCNGKAKGNKSQWPTEAAGN